MRIKNQGKILIKVETLKKLKESTFEKILIKKSLILLYENINGLPKSKQNQ